MDDEQARRIARLRGMQRNGAIGQLEIEKISSHCAGLPLSSS
jgi:hypothetical protein